MAAALALLSSAMWGTADYLGGRLSRRWGVLLVMGGVQLVGLLVTLIVAVLVTAWDVPLGYLPGAAVAALGGGLGLACYYRALALGPMGVVAPIGSLGVMVPVGVGVALGDRPSAIQVVGIVVAIVGVVLASGPELSGEVGRRALGLAVAAAGLLGVSQVGMAAGSETSVVMTMTAMRTFTVSAVAAVALISMLRRGNRVGSRPALRAEAAESAGSVRPRQSHTTVVAAVVAAGVFDAAATLAFGAASTLGMLTLVAVFGSLYPVVTVLLARVVDGERLRAVQRAGVALALCGAAAISAG